MPLAAPSEDGNTPQSLSRPGSKHALGPRTSDTGLLFRGRPVENRKIAVIGLGLIGGSLGLALAGKGYEITGIDRNRETLARGLKLGAASRVTENLADGVKGAAVVFLAVPVGAASEVLKTIAPHLSPGVIVSDVGSVKTSQLRLAQDLLPAGVDFVGGHPMAGTEQAGIDGADPLMFVNAVYVLTPAANCSPGAVEEMAALARQAGAHPLIMDPVKHDRAVATLSHLPHLLAVALTKTAGKLEEEEPGSLALAAGSFRDGTRVAASSPVMWQDICLANREMILSALKLFQLELAGLEEAVRDGDGVNIAGAFRQAGEIRESYKQQAKTRVEELVEVVISIPDEPGYLGTITRALGEANINIVNIEIIRAREGAAGSVVLGFQGEAPAVRALDLIRGLGIQAHCG